MAQSRSKFSAHQIHSFLQHRKIPGMWMATIAGLAVGGLIVAHSWYQGSLTTAPDREAMHTRLEHSKSALAKLNVELAEQKVALAQVKSAAESDFNGTNFAGFTDDDVRYWRKQLDAYSRMTGVQVDIIGQAPSQYRNSIMLMIKIEPSGNTGGSVDIIKALDFLQLYGYVQTFDGMNAVIHINQTPA